MRLNVLLIKSKADAALWLQNTNWEFVKRSYNDWEIKSISILYTSAHKTIFGETPSLWNLNAFMKALLIVRYISSIKI